MSVAAPAAAAAGAGGLPSCMGPYNHGKYATYYIAAKANLQFFDKNPGEITDTYFTRVTLEYLGNRAWLIKTSRSSFPQFSKQVVILLSSQTIWSAVHLLKKVISSGKLQTLWEALKTKQH